MSFTALTQKDRFNPLAGDHPAVGTPCIRCGNWFQEGEIPAIADKLDPGDRTRAYIAKNEVNSSCHIIHQFCVDTFWSSEDEQT